MTTLKISSDLQNAIKKVVLDTYFPVGSLYLTVGSENPNNTIGGTWTKISGYYLYADTSINNTSYTGKHTQSHTLTLNEIPPHTHSWGSWIDWYQKGGTTGTVSAGNSVSATSSAGGGQGHSHNIATKGIYVWQRTA